MKRLRLLRHEFNETQLELAKVLDVPQPTLSSWERGVHRPPNKMIFKIADHYGVTPDYLLEFSDSREIADPEPIRLLREYLNAKRERLGMSGYDYKTEELREVDELTGKFIKFANRKK